MRKACLLDQTLQLPPIGRRVAIHDDDQTGLPHPGTVCGHGTSTVGGSMIDPSTPLVPIVLVAVDQGVMLSTNANAQPCHISVVAVHPDNLLLDEYGNYEAPLEVSASDAAWQDYRARFGLSPSFPHRNT